MLSAWTWNAAENAGGNADEKAAGKALGIGVSGASQLSGAAVQPQERSLDPSLKPSLNGQPANASALRQRIRSAAAQIPVLAAAERLAQRFTALGAGARHRQAARPAHRILTNLALGGRKSLTLVEIDGQRYLVGCGAESVTAILPVPAPACGSADASRETQ
jgi:hypothetical protein